MEHTLTKKQAQAIVNACRHWKDDIRMITDEESYAWYSEWTDYLHSISFNQTIPVDMRELYMAISELCVVLTDKIDMGELK